MALRPHHGMCLTYFVGEGYSEGFSRHMAQVKGSLTPKSLVTLVVGSDVICCACPRNRGGVCMEADQVASYDRGVLDLCGLQEGQTLLYGEFHRLVRDRILVPGLRRSICGGCQWEALCEEKT